MTAHIMITLDRMPPPSMVLLSEDPLQSYITMSCHVLLNINQANIFYFGIVIDLFDHIALPL